MYAFPDPRSSHLMPQKSETVCQNSPTSEMDQRWRSCQLVRRACRGAGGGGRAGGERVVVRENGSVYV